MITMAELVIYSLNEWYPALLTLKMTTNQTGLESQIARISWIFYSTPSGALVDDLTVERKPKSNSK